MLLSLIPAECLYPAYHAVRSSLVLPITSYLTSLAGTLFAESSVVHTVGCPLPQLGKVILLIDASSQTKLWEGEKIVVHSWADTESWKML